jgi:YidC/Oxa1 family membrane protein insertase
LGNYGLAIIVFTIALRLVFYPMSEASYRNMEQMKALQPEMQRIKERHSNDPVKMNEEVTALYKKEKLNPLAGCLPILVQIPVFFALYKVLLVAIEMRHAPFYGWIKDLSAPDPSNLFTLFGVFPWSTPTWLHLGILPIVMGLTMFIQQKLSPPPPDKTTAQIFNFMPIMFTFLLASMSAGLVIYWTFSNVLAIMQQTLIKHRITKSKAS